MNIWFASGNKGKVSELNLLFNTYCPDVKIIPQSELGFYSSPPETGATFLDNARIKAKSLKAVKNSDWVVAEDSGLCVDGMNGLPGVHSARYAGEKARDSENNAKLLKMMQIRSISPRTAFFFCQMVVITASGEEWLFDGTLKGVIAATPKGLHGFGYDPLFIPEGETQSLAELGSGFKSNKSHRAQATLKFIERLKSEKII